VGRWIASFTRRGFLARAAALLAAFAASLPFARAALAVRKIAIPLDKVPDIKEVGGGVVLTLKGHKVMLIRKSETAVSAIHPACKHKKCQVLYKAGWNEIRCKCHGSKYDLDGKVQNPPAKEDLNAYPASLEAERIILELPDEPLPEPAEPPDDAKEGEKDGAQAEPVQPNAAP
jgi:Rieske Fe-S protein